MKLIFEKSVEGRKGLKLSSTDVPVKGIIPEACCRAEPVRWPQVSELDVVRHFTALSQRNFSVDTHFYPLGSCTMKYNPKINEALASEHGFAELHPLLPQLRKGELLTQGALQVLFEMERLLGEITGFPSFSFQPLAGAHGELTGCMMMAAYHRARGNTKSTILVPDSSHGTNPASAAIAGYAAVPVPTGPDGVMDLEALEQKLDAGVAGVMMTCPNTAGIFHPRVNRISEMVHSVDGLMYYDGANLNAVMGRFRPADAGFDLMHINLHKTFSTPHGGGGPGAGPVGVNDKLAPYLPVSRVERHADGHYFLNYDHPDSIGYIAAFYGNFAIILRAYVYLLILGRQGLKDTSDHAVLNANYLRAKLKEDYDLPFDRTCMHEAVFSAARQAAQGVHAVDLAKYLIDRNIHPPTVYFPLTVKEALMIEPTETESKDTMDGFIRVMREAARLAAESPEELKACPRNTPVARPDEVKAARNLDTNYFLNTRR